MAELKKDWTLSPEAFRRLLDWLDNGNDSGGQQYMELRGRLTAYFDRKNCACSDVLADETLNRIARKLEEKGTITDISALHYCYIVAKFVFLESVRRAEPIHTGTTELLSSGSLTCNSPGTSEPGLEEIREKMFACLEKCLAKLSIENRRLVLEYYRGERRVKIEHRLELAARLGLSKNALSIRICRIRDTLETCVRACLARK